MLKPVIRWPMPWSQDEGEDSQASTAREIERRRQRGEPLIAVEPAKGNKLAQHFWGIAWQHHLESYADYHSRLTRGRTTLRQGKVFDLEINEGVVTAVVAGQALHEVIVKIKPVEPERWQQMQSACAGQVGSVLDLLTGKLGDGVMKIIANREDGLFPAPKEIKVICDCPDDADLCPHGAAVLYGIGLRFDAEPALFFKLRGVDHRELVSQAQNVMHQTPASDTAVIADSDLAAVFGIDLGAE